MKRKYLFLILVSLVIICFASASGSQPMLLRIIADGQGMQNETVVYFDSSATIAYDPVHDAPALGTSPGYVNIVSCFNNIDYQVKGLPALTQGISIPLRITTGTSGSYQIYCNGINNLPQSACLLLTDNLTGTSWDVRNGAYTCVIADTEQVSRFNLNIITSLLSPVTSALSAPACTHSADGKIVVNVGGNAVYNYFWKDAGNNIIKTSLNKASTDTLAGLDAGFYRVDVNTAGTCNSHVIYFTLEPVYAPVAAFVSDTLVAEQSDVTFVNTSLNANSYWWEFGDGMGSNEANPLYAYGAPGTYTVTLQAFGSVCNDTASATRLITVTGSTAAPQVSARQSIVIGRDRSGYYVQFYLDQPVSAEIVVTDLLGKNRLAKKENITNNRIYIDTDGLSGNILLVHVRAGAQSTFRKIVVE